MYPRFDWNIPFLKGTPALLLVCLLSVTLGCPGADTTPEQTTPSDAEVETTPDTDQEPVGDLPQDPTPDQDDGEPWDRDREEAVDQMPDLPLDRDAETPSDIGADDPDLILDPVFDTPPDADLDTPSDTADAVLDADQDIPPAPVRVTDGDGWYQLDNELVVTRAYEDGAFEVGLSDDHPFVMAQDPEDHDILCITSGGQNTCDGLGALPPLSPGDSLDITQTILSTSRTETCVHTRYEGFPTGEPWVITIVLVWDVCLSEGADEVVVRLQVEEESEFQVLDELYFPYAPGLDPLGTGYAAIPADHGLLLPVGWLTSSPPWTSAQNYPSLGTCGVFTYEPEPAHYTLPMAFFGVVEDDGRALYVENRSSPDVGIRIRQVLGAEPRVTPRFRSQLGRFDNGGIREIHYVPMTGVNYTDLALRYRDWVVSTGLHVPLADKMLSRPHLDRLVGGLEISVVTCRYDNKSEPPAENVSVSNTFTEVADQIEAIATAAENPITRGLVHVDGWGQRGYDNLHPDVVYPATSCTPPPHASSDCGPCEAAGGWTGLAALSDYLNTVDANHQFLFGLHDNYRDFYLDSLSYNDGADAVRQPGGVLPPPYSAWDGGWQQVLCASRGLGYLQRNLDLLEDHGVEPAAYYMDVIVGGAPPDECFSEEHPMTRAECLVHRAAMLEELVGRGMVVSSELPSDWAVPNLDHVYWNYYLRHRNPDLASPDRQHGYMGYNTPIGLPVPLWDLVFHDALIVPWPYLHGDRGENLLDAWLSAGTAEVDLAQLGSSRIRGILRQQMALHRELGSQAMVDHRYLDGRFMVQEALYEGGARTVTDRSDLSLSCSGVLGVDPGPHTPNPWYLVSASISDWTYSAPDLEVTLEWITREDLSGLPSQRVFLHAMRDGIAANGDHWPGTPTTEWVIGEPVTTGPGILTIPSDGSYTLVAGLYDPATGRLPILAPNNFALELAHIEVSGGAVTMDSRPYAEARLVMARVTGPRQVEVMTEWYVGQPMPEGLLVFFHVNDGDAIIENADYWPSLPIHQWPYLARRREARRTLDFEASEVPGTYTLVTGMWDPVADERVDFQGTDPHQRFVLGRLILQESTEMAGTIDQIRFCPANIDGCL